MIEEFTYWGVVYKNKWGEWLAHPALYLDKNDVDGIVEKWNEVEPKKQYHSARLTILPTEVKPNQSVSPAHYGGQHLCERCGKPIDNDKSCPCKSTRTISPQEARCWTGW